MWRKNGDNVATNAKGGQMVFMHGRVIDFETKKPLVGATVEMWEASTNGLYEQQDPDQVEHNLRGKFKTDEEGRYYWYCLRPTPYPVPDDGMSFILTPFSARPLLSEHRTCRQASSGHGPTPVQTCSHPHHRKHWTVPPCLPVS